MSEEMRAYELGCRSQISSSVWLDVAGFFNSYDGLIFATMGTPEPYPGDPTRLMIPLDVVNSGAAETWGIEGAVDWRISRPLHLRGIYSLLRQTKDTRGSSAFVAAAGTLNSPENQLGLQANVHPCQRCELSLWGRYVDQITMIGVGDYATLDTRLAYALGTGVEIALLGKDLLQKEHTEFVPEIMSVETRPERRFIGSISWRF